MLLASADQFSLVGEEDGRAVGRGGSSALLAFDSPVWQEASKPDNVPTPHSVRNSLRFISIGGTTAFTLPIHSYNSIMAY